MGRRHGAGATSTQQVLVRPEQELRKGVVSSSAVPAEGSSQELPEQAERCRRDVDADVAAAVAWAGHLQDALVEWWGSWLTFRLCSWSTLQARLDREQGAFIKWLRDREERAHKDGCGLSPGPGVAEARVILLHGSKGPEVPEIGMLQHFSQRYVKISYNQRGHVVQTTAVNVATHVVAEPGPPSLSELGVQEELDGVIEQAQQDGQCWLVLLDQTYLFHYRDPPHGPRRWDSETVLLFVRMDVAFTHVVQITAASMPDEHGMSLVVGTNLAGTEVASFRLSLEEEEVSGLCVRVAEQVNCLPHRLRLVFPGGMVAVGVGDSQLGARKVSTILSCGAE